MASLKELYSCGPSLPVEIWCQIIEANSLFFCETCQIWNTIQHCSDCTTLICNDCATVLRILNIVNTVCSKCASERWCPTERRINRSWTRPIGDGNCDYYTESSSCSFCHYLETCDKCEKKVCCRHSIRLPFLGMYTSPRVELCIPCTQCLVQEQLQYKTSLP